MSSINQKDSLRYISDETHAAGKAENGGTVKIYHESGDNTNHVATATHLGAKSFRIKTHDPKYDNHSDKSAMTAGIQAHHDEVRQANAKPSKNLTLDTKQKVKMSALSKMDNMIEQLEALVKAKKASEPLSDDRAQDAADKMDKIAPLIGAAARMAPAVRAIAANPVARSAALGAVTGGVKGYNQGGPKQAVSGAVSGAIKGGASGALKVKKAEAVESEPKDPLKKPPVSEAQRRAMHAAARGESTIGIPQSVGKEFAEADKGGKLPEKKKDKASKADLPKHPQDISNIASRHKGGVIPANHPDRQAMASYITKLNSSGQRGEALRLYQNHISGTPGDYTAGVKKSDVLASISVEALTKSIRSKFKDSEITEMMKAAYDLGKIHYTTYLEWQNFQTINPSVLGMDRTLSKAPSIQPSLSKSEELADNEFELVEWDNGDFDLVAGKDVPEKYIDFIAKSMCAKNGCEEVKDEDDDKAEKKDRCWDGYEPTPGKKAYEKGSCQPIKKAEDMSGDKVDSSMMMGDLAAIKKHADEIMQHVDHKDVAPDWVKSKVAESASHLSAVADYVAGLSKSETEESLEKKKKSFNLKAKHKSDKGGLTEEGRKAYNRATGSNLKKPQPGGGPRKRSFCARNKGQINMHNIDCRKTPEKRACKARRRWKC